MPGMVASMPKIALPVTMSGRSNRALVSFPMYRHSERGLSVTSSFLGTGNFRCCGGQFSIAQLAAAGAMDDGVRFGDAIFRRYIPLRGGGRDQHGPAGGAHVAHLVEKAADRVRAVGILVAVFRIARRLIDLYFGPVGIEFVGNHQRKRGSAAAAHLGAAGDDGHSAVARDGEKKVWAEMRWRR